jgi:MFS family permease
MSQFSISPTQMGTVYTALLIAYTICMTPGGWVIDRWGPKKALVILGLGSAIFEACTGLGGYGLATGGMVLASFLVIRTLLGVVNAPLHPGTSRMVPSWIPFPQHGWANGLLQGAAGAGMASVSILFGYLIDWFEWRWAFFILGAVMGLLTLVWMVYATDDPRRHPSVNQAELEIIQELSGGVSPLRARRPRRLTHAAQRRIGIRSFATAASSSSRSAMARWDILSICSSTG